MKSRRLFSDWIGFALVVGVCLGVYYTTVARTVTGIGDADELLTSGWVGGVPHPPGYPLLNALVYGAEHLPIRGGTIALRGHLVSSLAQALAVGLAFLAGRELLRMMGKPSTAAWFEQVVVGAGALMLGFSYLFWLYANTLEVVGLNDLLAMLVIWLSLRISRASLILGVTVGMMLAHHQTSFLLLPGLLVWWGGYGWRFKDWLRLIFGVGGGFVGSVSLLLAFNRAAWISWRFSPTLWGWWQFFWREDFGGVLADGTTQAAFWSGINVDAAGRSLWHYLSVSLPAHWGWALIPIVVGLMAAYRRLPRRWFYGLLLLYGTSGLLLAAYLSIPDIAWGPHDYYLTRGLTERMYVLGYMVMSLFGILGLWDLAVRVAGKGLRRWVAGMAVAVAVPGGLFWSNYTGVSLRDYTVVDTLAKTNLGNALPQALIVCQSDLTCFSLLYHQAVLSARPDVLLLPLPPQLRDTYLATMTPSPWRFWYPDNPLRVAEAAAEFLVSNRPVYTTEQYVMYTNLLGLNGDLWGQMPAGPLMQRIGCGLDHTRAYTGVLSLNPDTRNSFGMWLLIMLGKRNLESEGPCPGTTTLLAYADACDQAGDVPCLLQKSWWATLRSPFDAAARLYLAQTYERTGYLELAEREYRHTLELDAGNAGAEAGLVRTAGVKDL